MRMNILIFASSIVALLMISFVSCKKVDHFGGGKYYLSLDSETLNGRVYYSIDGNDWHVLSIEDTVIYEGKYWFKAEADMGYQFSGWLQTDILFPNETPIEITVNQNVVIHPNFTPISNEYTVTLGTIQGHGSISYSIDNGISWSLLNSKLPVKVVKGSNILFRADPDAGKFFWHWDNLYGYGGTDAITTPIIVNQDFSVSATFGDYKLAKVAIKKGSISNGDIQWSTNQNIGFHSFKTVPEFDSVNTGTIVYFKAIPSTYYEVSATNTWSISSPHSFIEPITDAATLVSANITSANDAIVTAHFSQIQHTVTVEDPGNGNIIEYNTDGGATYEVIPPAPWKVGAGTMLYFRANAHTGSSPYFRFDKWKEGGSNHSNYTTILINKDTTLAAYFIRQYQIQVSAMSVGGADFKIKGKGTSTAGNIPAENFEVKFGDIGYFDEGTSIVGVATPITASSHYYRMGKWNTPLVGILSDGVNTSDEYTPSKDEIIASPTFIQQYELTINALSTDGFFTISNNSTHTPGGQPASSYKLNSSNSNLTGYYDANTEIIIVSEPGTNKKIRYDVDGKTDQKLLTYTLNANTSLTGKISDLQLTDLFNMPGDFNTTSAFVSGNDEHFCKAYTSPNGKGPIPEYTNGRITFRIEDNSGRLSAIKIENTSSGGTYSGRSEDFGINSGKTIVPSISSNIYEYELITTKDIGKTPAGTKIVFQLTVRENPGNSEMGVILKDDNGAINFHPVYVK